MRKISDRLLRWYIAVKHNEKADLDHACLDGVGDVDARLEAGRALAVQRLDSGSYWEAGGQRGCAELGGTASWGEDGADGNVFNEGGVDAGAFNEGLEGAVEEVGALGVFEAALAALGKGGAEGACYDDLEVGVRV